jgi:hypothetical protein
MTHPNRVDLRAAVLTALDRLRAEFPLEARLTGADRATRRAYAGVLDQWRRGLVPPLDCLAPETRARLAALDAIVPSDHGLGCYPFSARDTGIRVQMPAGAVAAMCAVDALAIARLVDARTEIAATCAGCQADIRLRVEGDGSLDHDQTARARVVWLATDGAAASCSQGLCRALRFLCPQCAAPDGSDSFTLPQATAIGNAFFGFQRVLLRSEPGTAA